MVELLLRGSPDLISDVENMFNTLTLHSAARPPPHLASTLATLTEQDAKLIEMVVKKVQQGQIEIQNKANAASQNYENFKHRLQQEDAEKRKEEKKIQLGLHRGKNKLDGTVFQSLAVDREQIDEIVMGGAEGAGPADSQFLDDNSLLKSEHQQMVKYQELHKKINGFKDSIQQKIVELHSNEKLLTGNRVAWPPESQAAAP